MTASRVERDRRYNRSEKGRARSLRWYHNKMRDPAWRARERVRQLRKGRRRLGWYEPGGMATDEELSAFAAAMTQHYGSL